MYKWHLKSILQHLNHRYYLMGLIKTGPGLPEPSFSTQVGISHGHFRRVAQNGSIACNQTSTLGKFAAAAAKSRQSCPTLWDPIDGSPPGSAVPGILQARTLEWVAISFSNERKWKVKVKSLSRVWLLVTPRTAAYQAPPSKGFSRQEYWSGVPLPSLKFDD